MQPGWQAQLQLGFSAKYGKTVLAQRRHIGPLTVQRPFYPEGEVCHVYLLHPPGGVVAGDQLLITSHAEQGSAGLITTPAATKFYRSEGLIAQQTTRLSVEHAASLEWLPQETIIYQGAQVVCDNYVDLAQGARFIGWEVLALGRPAADEGFDQGTVTMAWHIRRDNQLFYRERLVITPEVFAALWGLQGQSACATLFAYPATTNELQRVRALIGEQRGYGVTLIDDLLVCRALATRADKLRAFYQQLWHTLRPDIMQRQPCAPRIWFT